MAIAIFSLFRSLFAPRAAAPSGYEQVQRGVGSKAPTTTIRQATNRAAPTRTVRVIHKGPGRLVISGRLADVCAELDRLCALEAQAGLLAPAR